MPRQRQICGVCSMHDTHCRASTGVGQHAELARLYMLSRSTVHPCVAFNHPCVMPWCLQVCGNYYAQAEHIHVQWDAAAYSGSLDLSGCPHMGNDPIPCA